MRQVMNTQGSKEESAQCAELRLAMEQDRQKFLATLIRLESEERAAAKEKQGSGSEAGDRSGAGPLTPDETVEELRKLIGKMLEGTDADDVATVTGPMAQEGSARVAVEPEDAATDTG